MSSIFKRGHTRVHRQVVIPDATGALTFRIPRGAKLDRVWAQNKSTTVAGAVVVGNVAAGNQWLASTAVAVATVNGPFIVTADAIQLGIVQVDATVFVTVTGTVDLVIDFTETGDSLPLVVSGTYALGQQKYSAK